MKRFSIMLFLLLPVCFAMGQKTSVERSRVPLYLNTGVGMGASNYYDAGVSPLRYHGAGLGGDMGVTVDWCRFQASLEGRVEGCLVAGNKADSSAGANGVTILPRTSFMVRFAEPVEGSLRLWAGASVGSYVDIRINRKMMNAAVGLTMMFNLYGNFRLEYDIPSRRRTDLITLTADISLPLMGIGERPGYAYVYNATSSSDPVEYLMDSYESFGIFMSGATTDIGFYFNLKNRNKIGLNYRWDYCTTRHESAHRFDNAYHIVSLKLMFNIN